jgi:hypothetical protein
MDGSAANWSWPCRFSSRAAKARQLVETPLCHESLANPGLFNPAYGRA